MLNFVCPFVFLFCKLFIFVFSKICNSHWTECVSYFLANNIHVDISFYSCTFRRQFTFYYYDGVSFFFFFTTIINRTHYIGHQNDYGSFFFFINRDQFFVLVTHIIQCKYYNKKNYPIISFVIL